MLSLVAASCVLAVSPARAMAFDQADNAQADSETLKKEIEKLRNEKEYEAKRVEEMRQDREKFIKEIRRVENLNAKYTKEIEDIREQMSLKEQSFEDRLKKMEADLADGKKYNKAPAADAQPAVDSILPVEVERQAQEILQKGGDLDPEDEKFKEELARAHYNMGNVYFERGEYQRAVVEYYQAVDLMPYDPDAHYNLAFVSGEYLGDQETALKHYQWYLYLKPNASDKKLVEEKMVGSRLHSRSKTAAGIDNPDKTGYLNVGR
jgi:tetratricopeptide (TPR) repeat protein